jgi:signal transduction histidine kinase
MPVSPALAHEIFWIEAWHIAALILNVGGNAVLHRHADKTPLLGAYLRLQGALFLWIISKMLKTVSPQVDLRWFFIVTQYLAVCFLGPFFLSFAMLFRFGSAPPRALTIALNVLSTVFFIVVVTNPFHYLFYSHYDFWGDRFGPLFPWFTGYTYTIVTVSVVFCLGGIRKNRSMVVGLVIAVAALIPMVVNILYTTRLIRPLFDVTPIVMTTSVFFFALAAFRFNFFGPIPVARSVLLETLDDLIVFTDGNGQIIQARGLPSSVRIDTLEVADEMIMGERVYRLQSKHLRGLRGFRLYTDVSHLVRLRDALTRENLSLEEAILEITRRNAGKLFVLEHNILQSSRRALHDILGHSLTIVIFLLRRSLQNTAQEKTIDTKAVLNLCAQHVRDGLACLDRELTGNVAQEEVLSLVLQELVAKASSEEFATDLVSAGQERTLSPSLVGTLREACREAITNAVRHGDARRVTISLLWGRNRLALNICDDGRGCDTVEEGNGLELMRKALLDRGCTTTWQSEPGAGFQLSIQVPFQRN